MNQLRIDMIRRAAYILQRDTGHYALADNLKVIADDAQRELNRPSFNHQPLAAPPRLASAYKPAHGGYQGEVRSC